MIVDLFLTNIRTQLLNCAHVCPCLMTFIVFPAGLRVPTFQECGTCVLRHILGSTSGPWPCSMDHEVLATVNVLSGQWSSPDSHSSC